MATTEMAKRKLTGPHDSDGDGKYTADPRKGDITPLPAKAGKGKASAHVNAAKAKVAKSIRERVAANKAKPASERRKGAAALAAEAKRLKAGTHAAVAKAKAAKVAPKAKAVAKPATRSFDASKHPRGPDGRFISKAKAAELMTANAGKPPVVAELAEKFRQSLVDAGVMKGVGTKPPTHVFVGDSSPAVARAKEFFGRDDVTATDVAMLAGAPSGSTVTLKTDDLYGGRFISVRAESSGLKMERSISVVDGRPVIENVDIKLEETGTGRGTEIFASQVDAARSFGVAGINAQAFRGDGYNGYKTWARLGYDGDIVPFQLKTPLPPALASAKRVSDLMATSEGRDWWTENGHSFEGTFTITPGRSSYSERTLDAYREAKRQAGR